MGKIVKPLQPKHRETLSPWLKEFVAKVADAPLPKIPQLLADFPTTWPFSRGDLYHWIPLLNRFDSILECFCATYHLADGPQARDFTCEVLLNKGAPVEYCDSRTWTQADLQALGYGQDGDSALIVTILKFSGKLLEHCGNRSVYSSSAHLNDLLNSTSLAVLRATLEVGMELAQRYHASVKRMAHPSRHIGAALLASHYNIDLDRVQQLSQPFVKTPIISFSSDPLSVTPASASKGKEKEKALIPAPKNTASMYANDLVSLATSEPQDNARWNGWGDIKVVYYPKPGAQPPPPAPAQPVVERGHSTLPSTPTPLRRSSTMGSVQHRSPRVERAAGDDASSPVTPHISGFGSEEAAKSPQKTFEIAQSTVLKTPIYELLSRFPDDMPQSARYEVLNRLRVAKALLDSTSARQDALAVRLLAIANLSYIHQEVYFLEKVLKQDNDEPRRYQLVYQLAELIHPVQDGRLGVPLWLQTITFQLLEAISHFTSKQSDVLSALNANVNHGILLYVIRKAVAGMREDTQDESDTVGTEADDWRNSLFSLTLHMSVSARLGTEMIGAGIMENLVEILNIRTRVADRNHSMSLAFLDGLIYSYQGAFQSFVDAKGLDRISELTVDIVKKATEMTKAGHGTPPSLRSSVVDYEIPFYQQQTLKWLLKFIHHIMTSWYSFGSNTDRLLRNLVDNSELLGSLSHVIENMSCFGSVVWTNAMIIIGDFINNDPTSFAALMEAGLIKSFLESITGREVKAEHPNERTRSNPQAADDVGADEDAGSAEPDDSVLFEPDDRPHPPARETLEAPRSEPLARGILPSSEAMLVIPTVINSISLNNAGMKMVVSSRVIESYFEIFESAKHVRCLDTDLDHATNIGSSYDELARHHPSLRPTISNAVLDMVARVVHLGKEKAAKQSWGASLSVPNPAGGPLVADISLLDKSGPAELQGQDTIMATSGPDSQDSGLTDAEQPAKNFTPYVTAVANFLSTFTGNTSLKATFIHKGGIELLLDISELPSLPHDFADSKGAKVLQHVVSSLVENCPILGLPSLLRRTQAAVDALQPLVQHKGPQPFFAPFVRPDLSLVTESGEWDQQVIQQVAHGTQAVKALLTTQCLVKTLYNSLPQSNRQTISFPAVNVFDYYARLIETLGPLLRAVLAQEMDIAKIVPSHWPNSSVIGEDQPTTSADAATGAVASIALESQSAVATDPTETRVGARPSEPAAAPTSGKSVSPDEAKSVSYKNYEVLRALLHSMMPTSYPFFQGLGKALLPRRERDPWTRSQHLWIAEMLAQTIQAKWESGRELTAKDLHYSVVMLHSIDEMLIDTSRQSDRASTVIIPVLVAFKENGGFDTLHAMLRQFAEVAAKESDAPPSDSRPRLAKIGVTKILELYLAVVSGKNVWESVQQVNLAQRPDQRRDTSPIGAQLLVELRMSILPVVRELWESPLIEKAEIGVLNRVVNILKAIADVSCEANAYKKTDKQPPALFKREAVPFPWSEHVDTMKVLIRKGEEAGLVREAGLLREAVYRAFGSPEWAEEYIKAHEAGIAGTRNPVPPQDAYQEDGPSEPAPSEAQAPALTGPVVVSGDPMAVDPAPDLDRLIAVSDTLSERPAPSAPTGDAAGVSCRASETREAGGASSSSARPSQTPSKAPSTPQPPAVTKEDLDVERMKLRKDLIDRCLDVIRAHPASVYDVADLISVTVPLKSDTNEEARQEVGETLANALISFDTEDKASASSIAAYAHLLSILLQDSKPFFRACVDTLKMNVGQYLGFLKTSEESSIPPWIPYVLLIFEIALTDDEQPVEAKWPIPSADAETMPKLELEEKEPIVNQEERAELFQAVMEILPRAGVNDMLAIAILRILLILTRDREFAKAAGEKKQLHRIFAMAKQLSGLGSTRFKETKIGLYVMTILRHIVEDDDTLRQIFRFEIRAFFDASSRQSRNIELHAYLRSLSPFAMRSPRVFIEVTEELVKIPKWPHNAEDGQLKHFTVALKEPLASASANEAHVSKDKDTPKDDSVEPAVQQATQDLNINDVKPTTEPGDKEMTDAPKTPGAEAKRPIVENPDGVINFLLDQLLSFQKVDAEPVNVGAPSKDKSKEPASSTAAGVGNSSSSSALTQPTPASEQGVDDVKDKKQPKPQFKAEEHPIFVYRCFLLHCLSELLYSYNRAKIEFINFKRGAPLLTNTPVKPRSSVLNYLLNDLLCVNSLQPPSDSLAYKKKVSTADQARMVLVALVAKTSEKPLNRHARRFDPSDEVDLNFVRKFVLDTVLRAYREAASSGESFDVRYGKMQSLAELMYNMIDDKEAKEPIRVSPDAPRSQSQIKRLMYEKGYIAALTSSIADVDLTYPGVKRTIKYILRVLRFLTNTAILLSADGVLPPSSTDSVEDEILSASSLSDLDEEREETPDLYRNSALGMLEPREDDDFSDDESEDDDEEMYDDEYPDEVGYNEEMSEDDDENVSDEDEELGEMGHIEGLPGEPAVMEVIMGDQDDEDESMDDDDDDDDDSSDDDDDDEISDALEEVEDHHEVVDENGSPVDDDGASEWESDSDNENDEEEEEIDFEAQVQDLDEVGPLGHFGNINYSEPRFSHDFLDNFPMDERFAEEDEADDDEEDEEDEMDEDVFIFDRDNMGDDQPQPSIAPGLGWDSLVIDQPSGAHRHRHGGIRSPFPAAPQAVVIGGAHGDRLNGTEFRNFFRPRSGPPPTNHDDGVNPLLRRQRPSGRDASPRPGVAPALRFPHSFFTASHDNPISLINELITSIPQGMSRNGIFPSFQLHISQEGPHGEVHEFHIPVPAGAASMRDSRNDANRPQNIYHEPQHAVSFMPASTVERWLEEAKILFGPAHNEKVQKIFFIVLSKLAPQAIADDKEAKRKEAERKRELEEARRRQEEEERRKKAEAEAEAKAAREKEEAEKKAKEEREAAEAAEAALLQASQSEARSSDATSDNQVSEPQSMEGVETAETARSGSLAQQAGDNESQERLMTSIRGEQIDITGLGIDPEYLAALPEEFREEVIAQTLTTRRSEARQQAENSGQETEAFNEFLDALPEELRQEIIQQEAQERRRRQREERQRDNNANSNASVPQEMDAASILLTFDATLREEILMDQHEELAEHLPADMVAQARAAAERRSATAASAVYRNREAIPREGQRSDHSRQAVEVAVEAEVKPTRQPVPQMLDKAGVATLLRLMFISQPAAIRTHHFGILSDVCENRQNRLEVISTLLQILQDGSTDMDAVERSFGQLSLKARQPKEKDLQKTPTSLKRSLTSINPSIVIQHNSDVSPLMIVQQCLDLLGELCRNLHIPSLFLTEHEILGSSLKRTLSRKGKGKDLKANKYAINSLLSLLGRSLVMESSAVMQLLADLLNKVTYPLQALERRRREAEEEAKKAMTTGSVAHSTGTAGASTTEPQAGQSSSTTVDNTEAAPMTTADSAPAAEQGDADADKPKTEEAKTAEAKKSRQLQPPVIPFHNLTLVVNIFVARECSSKTFQNTISTIKNLSNIPGAKVVFGQELVRQARLLSENIVRDLDDLLPHILKAESGTEIQGVALAKFSPGASEQNKLLRVLTALDHLFDSKAKKTEDESAGKESEKQEFISSLYHNSTFGTMWEKLSACLSAIHQRENMVNVATILLPLIESLMVVCKNTTLSDTPASQSQMSKEMLLSSPPPENRMAGLFFNFTEDHRRVLNELVRNNPKLMSGTFSLLVKNPKVLEFDNKRNYFNRSVHAKSGNQTRPSYAPLQLSVRRDHVFHDSFKSLYFKKGEEMKYGKLNIRFHGEEGVDAGGVTREWFQVLSRQMFDPNYVLFIPVSSDRTTFHPNKLSSINDEHLMFFKFIGRIIGKALYEGRVLDCYFSRAVYKRILGKPVSVKDMESFDPEYYKSLVWMLENDITDIITETFAVEDDAFGATETVDLCENGRHIPVTEDNKHDYVRLVVEHKLLASVKDQMAEFLTGFHDIIPAELIAIFNEQELELLISGLPDIDVDDWKSHTEYHNYTPSSQQIQWFWRAVRSFDKEERAKLLQFVTGTSKVPLNGFKELEGMNGVSRFNIHRDYGNKERLPSSHTCFNQLDLPEYESYEILRAQIMKAITAGSDYFGFA